MGKKNQSDLVIAENSIEIIVAKLFLHRFPDTC